MAAVVDPTLVRPAERADQPAERLGRESFVAITSFKRDGTPVATPVWCVEDAGTQLVFTEARSWKVKRIGRNPRVLVAPCGARGKPRGAPVGGRARVLDHTSTVTRLLAEKYGFVWRGYTAFTGLALRVRRQPAPPAVTIEITFD